MSLSRADGTTLWYEVQARRSGWPAKPWEKVPGWYTSAEARQLRAIIRRSGYGARVVRCELIR